MRLLNKKTAFFKGYWNLKSQRARLDPLPALIETIAEKEAVHCKTIATLSLQFASSSASDYKNSSFCQEIVQKGTLTIDSRKYILVEKSTQV